MRFNVMKAMCLLAIASGTISGCGQSGPELAEVTGTITIDGHPAPKIGVVFRPASGTGSPSYGGTDPQGVYRLMFTRDKMGAMPGDYEVDLEVNKLTKSELAELKAEGKPEPPPPPVIPKKYKQSGGLTATVKSGKNTIDFPLDSK